MSELPSKSSPLTPPPPPPSVSEPSLLAGVNILLEGPTGTGKTYASASLADIPGLEVFYLFTEAGIETLLGVWTDSNREIPSNVHWHVLPRGSTDFATLAQTAETINASSQDSLHKMQDPKRSQHNQFVTLLRALNNFPDDRTGEKFGNVGQWGPNRCLVIDSFSGLNPIALSLVVGGKPVKSQADWGIAQDQLEKFIRQCTDGCKCHFVLLAHVEREVDQVLGGTKITVSTLGRALAPKIPPLFSDVVLAVRNGTKWSWSTANSQADLKTRNLPWSEDITPGFKQIFDKWQSRGGKLTPIVKS